jgi:hypothetical protein
MRFVIQVDAEWNVSVTLPPRPEILWRRTMRKWPDGRNGYFPGPPAEQMPAATESHYDICAGDADAFWRDYNDITGRSLLPGSETIKRFGRYLFAALIGSEVWNDIQRIADEASEQFIELSLSWQSTAGDLHRLNWELMYAPDDFIFRSGQKRIAITRLVAGTNNIKSQQASSPPRMLFLIGTSLADAQIRPGAEYLGLLRQLKHSGRSIHSRVLQRASPQRIKEVMKSYEPDVVHFICHGGFDTRTQRSYLELELDEKEAEKKRGADQLLEYLNVGGKFPGIVVLSACNSGNVVGANEVGPLAAELVAGGVPVVVGMAGQISDRACRLFTRRFGEALVIGESLVLATGEGRRAAFSEGAPPQTSADWAFPTVFLAEGVDPGYIPVQPDQVNTGATVLRWTEKYKIERDPVFCSREEFLDQYHQLFRPPQKPSVLAAYTERTDLGYGRTRLLQQLAVVALRDGHVPCVVDKDKPTWLPPSNVSQLCGKILEAIGRARDALGLAPPEDSDLLKVLTVLHPSDDFQKAVQRFRENPKIYWGALISPLSALEDNATVNDIKEALRCDLSRLIIDAQQKHPEIIKADSLPVLLLDEVHLYHNALYPLFTELLPLFYDEDRKIPVVLTLSFNGLADEQLRSLKEKSSSRPRIRFMPLKEFEEGEDLLAYEQVFLHPFKEGVDGDIWTKPYAFNYNVSPEIIERFVRHFRSKLKRIPDDFNGDILYMIADIARDFNFLIAADDETFLARERERE